MATVERGQRIRVALEDLGRLGEAKATLDGKPLFVSGGIPGEEVEVEVIRERRHYVAAEVVRVFEASPHRIVPECGYFGACTGCQWQHIDYDHQLDMKRRIVDDALQRVGGLESVNVLETLPSPQRFGYRNHARFTVGPEGRLGYVHRERRRFVDIERCMLMDPWINDTLGQLQGRCAETTQLSIRYGPSSGSWLIQPTLTNPDIPVASGQKHYTDVVAGVPFRVAASSFFQVNTPQAERLVELVRQSLGLSSVETVVDAYAGVGTFAALLAPYASKVIAIEESASAIQDANESLSGVDNLTILRGKTEEALGDLTENVDAVVLDPPRAGCQRQALDSLMRLAPVRVAYVSCDPETLARDLKVLAAGPYRIESVQPVDMFPQTHHVECVTTLALKAGHPITLGSSSPRRQSILHTGRVPFVVSPPAGDEAAPQGDPAEYVRSLALVKARQVASNVKRGLVLAADTVVVDGGAVLGKPRDAAEALEMLRRLRGRDHTVLTGVSVVDAVSHDSVAQAQSSTVTMRSYSDAEAEAFVASGAAADKAGAYAIQDPEFSPAEAVDGCFLNVVGLPLCMAVGLLRQMGADLADIPAPSECSNCLLAGPSE